MTQQQHISCLNSGGGGGGGGGIDESSSSSSRFNMASLKINLPPQNHKRRSRGGGLSRYYSGKARSFKCLNEVHSIQDLKKQQQQDYNNNNTIVPPPPPPAVVVDAHHHDSNNNNNKKKKKNITFSTSSSSSFCFISSMSKEDIKQQHTLFYA